jgi:phosphatidylglycerol:prolipoprotein diacylglycerol transferase
MFPIIQVGPAALQVPGLVLLSGLWIGLTLAERRVHRRSKDPGYLYNLIFIVIIAGVIGARLSYAATYPNAFASNPRSLISLNPGLLDPLAGALVAAMAAAIYLFRKNLPLWSTLDDLTILFAVMGVAFGISHFASGSAFGIPTEVPWGIHLWGANRHPTQIYEIVLAIIALIVIMLLDRTDWSLTPGNLFLSFISLSAVSRLFLEAFRGDSILLESGFRIAQIVSWLVLASCLLLLGWRIRRNSQEIKIMQ